MRATVGTREKTTSLRRSGTRAPAARIPPYLSTYRYRRRCYGAGRDRGRRGARIRALAEAGVSPSLLRRLLPASGPGSRSSPSSSTSSTAPRTPRGSAPCWWSSSCLAWSSASLPGGFDITSRRWILVLADPARAKVFFVLPFATSRSRSSRWPSSRGSPSLFRPAVYAGLPNLVSDEDLPQANGLLQTADNFTWAIGALVGGRSSRRRARMPPTW